MPPGVVPSCNGLGNGVFFYNGSCRFASIGDGLSHTIFVGERHSLVDYSTWVGVVHGVKHPIARIMGTAMWPPNSSKTTFEIFSSKHPEGAQFVFGDGSVRYFQNDIDINIWKAYATRDGSEVISD